MLWYSFAVYSFFVLAGTFFLWSSLRLALVGFVGDAIIFVRFLLSAIGTLVFAAAGFLFVLYKMPLVSGSVLLRASLRHVFLSVDFSSVLDPAKIYYFPFMYIFVFVTTLSLLFCLAYSRSEFGAFAAYCSIIFFAGYIFFFADSFVIFFLSYEMLLVPSFFILYRFAKTRRCVEAAYLMFFWTQFGALFLIFGFLYLFAVPSATHFSAMSETLFSSFEIGFLVACWFIGFGVKLPIWPFYGWLPKAHVEASTNFSIFLSGVLVKFAFFGLLRCMIALRLEAAAVWLIPFLVVGAADASVKLFYQIDLKKLVAYSTVVEMHWLAICIASGQSGLISAGFCMLVSHALLSSNSFLLVDAINRRFKTRLLTEIGGVNFLCPRLYLAGLINCLAFLGFPGSIAFTAEMLFFGFLFDFLPTLTAFFFLLLYFAAPTFFFRSWINVLFGSARAIASRTPADLSGKETLLYFGILFATFWLGLTWQALVF